MQNTTLCLATNDFVSGLLRLIKRALVGVDGRDVVDLLPLEGALAISAMQMESRYFQFPAAGRKDARTAVVEFEAAYLRSIHDNRYFLGKRAYPLLLDRITDTPERAFFADCPAFPEHQYGTTRQAAAMAEWNAVHARSVAAAIWFLSSQVLGESLKDSAELKACVDRAVTHLLNQAGIHERDELHLALVMGDSVKLEQLRARIAEDHFGDGKMVMQLFECQGRLPSRVNSEEEQGFRDEIAAGLARPLATEVEHA